MLGGVRNYLNLQVETRNATVNAGLLRSLSVGTRLFTRRTDAYCLNKSMRSYKLCLYMYVHMHVPKPRCAYKYRPLKCLNDVCYLH